jgi:sugar O-acyltransferase (sialic acid O-acetyltransferase NeuD family)
MENNIVLYGASGHCKVIIDILENNKIAIDTIIDDDINKKSILSYTITNSNQFEFGNKKVILSIGNNKVRKKLDAILNVTFATAFHPKAIISKHSKIDIGTVIMAGAIVNTDVVIGKHCIINTAAIIEHDCIIENFAHISPNASLAGGVLVGEGSQVGIGASVIQGIKIGKWVTIGAGTVVIKDIPDYAVVVGNPAKIIKYNTENE